MYVNFRSFPFKRLGKPLLADHILRGPPRYPLLLIHLSFYFIFKLWRFLKMPKPVLWTYMADHYWIYLQIRIWRQLSRINELQVRIWLWCTSRLMTLLRIYVTKSNDHILTDSNFWFWWRIIYIKLCYGYMRQSQRWSLNIVYSPFWIYCRGVSY